MCLPWPNIDQQGTERPRTGEIAVEQDESWGTWFGGESGPQDFMEEREQIALSIAV